MSARRVALALSGGIGLGAFEAGAWAGLDGAGVRPDWLLGASIGAVNAVLIAGGPPEGATARLRRFWNGLAFDPMPGAGFWLGPTPASGPLRRAAGDAAISQAMLFGRPGLFRPNPQPAELAPALYDLAPLRRTLAEQVDFDALHAPGAPRVTIAATDLLAGEGVRFDTHRGDRIGVEEVVASCALAPLFAPVELGGRLLGDGGLTANLPLAPALSEPGAEEVLCIAVELFGRQGSRPRSITAAAARAADIAFGSRTRDAIAAEARAHGLRAALRRLAGGGATPPEADGPRRVTVLLLGQRVEPDGAGVLKPFDFSRAAVAARWAAGEAAMQVAMQADRALPPAGPEEFVMREVTAPVGLSDLRSRQTTFPNRSC
jgi:NTE family protein